MEAQKAAHANTAILPAPITVNVGGDTIGSATVISGLPFSDTGNTCGYASNYESCIGCFTCPYTGTGGRDVVYRITPISNITVDIDLCASFYDTKVYVGDGGATPIVACNDDACGSGLPGAWQSRIEGADLLAGHTYYIFVDGFGAPDCGNYVLDVRMSPPPVPGDECANAFDIPSLPFVDEGDTCPFDDDYGIVCQQLPHDGKDLVYRYQPIASEYVDIDLCTSGFDSRIIVYADACPEDGGSIIAGCNDEACGEDGTRAFLGAVQFDGGRTYFVIVDGTSSNDCGVFELSMHPVEAPDYPHAEVAEISVGLRPIAICSLPAGDRVYATILAEDEVAVMDTQTDAVLETIPVGDGPYRITAHSTRDFLYTADFFGGTMTVVRPSTNEVIETVLIGGAPIGVAVHPSGEFLYVNDNSGDRVAVVSIPSSGIGHQVTATIPVGNGPRGVCFDPSGRYAYTSDFDGPTVTVIQTFDHVAVQTIPVDHFPQAICALPSGDFVVVGNFGFDTGPDHLSVIAIPQPTAPIQSHTVVSRVRVGTGCEEVVSSPDGRYLYVTNWGWSDWPIPPEERGMGMGSVTVLKTAAFTTLGNPNDPPMIDATVMTIPRLGDYTFGICILPSGEKLYAVNSGNYGYLPTENTISVIGMSPIPTAVGEHLQRSRDFRSVPVELPESERPISHGGDRVPGSAVRRPVKRSGWRSTMWPGAGWSVWWTLHFLRGHIESSGTVLSPAIIGSKAESTSPSSRSRTGRSYGVLCSCGRSQSPAPPVTFTDSPKNHRARANISRTIPPAECALPRESQRAGRRGFAVRQLCREPSIRPCGRRLLSAHDPFRSRCDRAGR